LQVGIFSVSTLKREAAFTIPFTNPSQGSAVGTITWSPRAPLLALTAGDGTLPLWNVAHKPRLVRPARGAPNPKYPLLPDQVVFSPDGTRVLEGGFLPTSPTASVGVAAVFRVSDGKLLWRTSHRNWSTDSVAMSDDGRTVALGQLLSGQKGETQ